MTVPRDPPRLTGDEELAGEVAAVVFANEATGFGVVELAGGGRRRAAAGARSDGPRATGPLAALVAGQSVRLVGRWKEHDRYGPTFEATYYEQAEARTADGLTAFLTSDRFPGVGTTLAERLVASFGLALGDVLRDDPARLTSVKGVSPQLAERIATAWRDAGALAALVRRLGAVGVPPAVTAAVPPTLGAAAEELLDADPYALLEVRGARWPHAEGLARAQGVDRRDDRRLVAGAVTAHREECRSGGHTRAADGDLAVATSRLLGVDPEDARRALDLAAARGALVTDTAAGSDGLAGDGPTSWYLPEDLRAERQLAEDIARLDRTSRSGGGPGRAGAASGDDGGDVDPLLTAEQRSAVDAALSRGVSVLTGGPGTGKTRSVLALVGACEARGLRVALCAPTGRAAKRMEEVTGRAATTVHRLLEARGVPGSGFRFGYDERRRLPHDVVVADEWSMADLRLARALTRALPDGAHLVLVGDADQLPSVGPGAVLRDLLDPRAAAAVATSRLVTVHRQAARSRIVTLAHEVNGGAVAPYDRDLATRDGDVFAIPERPTGIAARVAEIVAERAPRHFDCAPADVQVLAPMYRGPAGVDALNAALGARLNPAGGRPALAGFREGDRVVQTRNDADLDVANGDIGEVIALDRAERTLEVAFPHSTVVYTVAKAVDLAPAWCLTVHKAQGGEWPVVVVVLDGGHRALLARELVYTAITRAARGLLLVGDPGLLARAAAREGEGARRRRTGLAERVAAAVTETADAVGGVRG